MTSRQYFLLVVLTAFLAVVVIGLGAYTRLSHAGLGCPDWPGCYGELVVPESESHVEEKHYLDQRALEPEKAWIEMSHRYFAGALGLLILVITVISWKKRNEPEQPVWLPTILLLLVIFQAVLGMWTVTWQLKPVVVMGHLLGGFSTLALLVLLALKTIGRDLSIDARPIGRNFAGVVLLIVIMQIALGGWTSTNYAAVACPDFPTCQGEWLPDADFQEAFVLWRGLGVNYEFGILEHPARVAIHWTHRLGALITFVMVGWLSLKLLRSGSSRGVSSGWMILVLLSTQIILGISNVVMALPLAIAVAHNLVGAFLLLSVLFVNFQLWQRQR